MAFCKVSLLVPFLLAVAESSSNRTARQYDFFRNPDEYPCYTVRGYQGYCKPLVRCPGFAPERIHSSFDSCTLSDGSVGACCTDVFIQPGHRAKLFAPVKRTVAVRHFSQTELNEGSAAGIQDVEIQERFESFILEQDVAVKEGTPSFGHLQFFKPTPQARGIADKALRIIQATRQLRERFALSAEESGLGLSQISIEDTVLRSSCPARPVCTESTYRTFDGSCNNLDHPDWGKSMTPMQRILAPKYSDGVWSPRKATDGSSLPSARRVSTSLIADADLPRRHETLMVMLWGQWVDHDLDLSPVFVFKNGTGIECCTESGQFIPSHLRDPHCMAIEIPSDDYFYSQFSRRCMNFVRTMPGTRAECNFGYADQLNSITHWMDGSQVYGSDSDAAKNLRLFQKGLLKSTQTPSRKETLPLKDDCSSGSCFLAGDVRSTEQPHMTIMHTVWMREHNRIARILGQLNPHWSDETVFQETRRVVIGELQHITYNEFLPVLLGTEYLEYFGMLPLSQGYYRGYDKSTNPSINNEFATAAYRMGHSLVPGFLKLFSATGHVQNTVAISNVLLNVSGLLTPTWFDATTRGLLFQTAQNLDNALSKELTNRLFKGRKQFGFDLGSLNIQRGRDHGIAGYNSYREACGIGRAATFDDLAPLVRPQMVMALKRIYKSVDDIDLFVGGISESHVPGSMVGPTFLCILGDQFHRLKLSDRFFYELGGQRHSFTQGQLNEIRKVSLARVICDNNDGSIDEVQPLVFKAPLGSNLPISCDSQAIPRVNLQLWVDRRNF